MGQRHADAKSDAYCLTDYGRLLAEQYHPLALKIGRAFAMGRNVDISESIGVAVLSLCEAIAHYSPSRGPLPTYLYHFLTFRLIDWSRQELKLSRPYLRSPFDHDAEEQLAIEHREYAELDSREAFEHLMTLCHRDAAFMRPLFESNKKLIEIAPTLGHAPKGLHRRYRDRLGVLRANPRVWQLR